MPIEKYICRCGARVDKLTSYFKNGMRVTVCDDCAENMELNSEGGVTKIDYEKLIKEHPNDPSYHTIDTREKQ